MPTLCWIAFYAVVKNTRAAGCGLNRSGPNLNYATTRIQCSLLVVDFRFGSILCSHYSRKVSRKPIRYFKTEAAQHRSSTKIDPKSAFVCERSLIRYVYGAGTRAIRYRAVSHDVTAAILVYQNNETAAMLVYQTNPVGVELFSYVKTFFGSNKFAWLLAT